MSPPSLPPAFQLVRLDREVRAFERAVRAAPRGIEHGTVYWSDRGDLLDMALVLEPDVPAQAALQEVPILTVAACEALDQLLPPAMPVACAWPADLILNSARVGGVRALAAPTADPAGRPPWLVLGLGIQLEPPGDGTGAPSDRTSLVAQGAGGVTAGALLEAVTSGFLAWSGRALRDGASGVRTAWNRRCYRRGQPGTLVLEDERISGTIAGLDPDGRFVIGERRLDLGEAATLLA